MREPGRLTRALADEAATRSAGRAFAAALAAADPPTAFVTIAGDLGAGKTTWVRGALEALGIAGPVRSPTYTLIESYPAGARQVHHLDWYRLAGPDDLDGMGFRELLAPGHWLFVEWPERAAAIAAQADVAARLSYAGRGRRLEAEALTERGAEIVRFWTAGNA